MFCLILYFALFFSDGLGQKQTEKEALSSIITELKYLKSIQSEFNDRLSEIDDLRARVTSLETKVKGIEKENHELKDKIKHLEKSTERDDELRSSVSTDSVYVIPNQKNISISRDNEPNVSKLKQRIRNRQIPADARVAFTAGVSVSDLVPLGSHHTIIFDNAITNIGNAYHRHTGIFMAPHKGAYVFTLTMMVSPRHTQYLEIVLDGKIVNAIYASAASGDNYVSATKQWIIVVNQGSEVWIRTDNAGQLHGNMHSLFSGYLLFETE